jgi:hypothetical protein
VVDEPGEGMSQEHESVDLVGDIWVAAP